MLNSLWCHHAQALLLLLLLLLPSLPFFVFLHSILLQLLHAPTIIPEPRLFLLMHRIFAPKPFLSNVLHLGLVCPPVMRAAGGRAVGYVPLADPLLLLLGTRGSADRLLLPLMVLLIFLGAAAALSLTAPLLLGGSVVVVMVGVGCRRTGSDGVALLLVAPLSTALVLLWGWLVVVILLLLVQLAKVLCPLPGPLRLKVLQGKGQPLEIAVGTQTLCEGPLFPMEI